MPPETAEGPAQLSGRGGVVRGDGPDLSRPCRDDDGAPGGRRGDAAAAAAAATTPARCTPRAAPRAPRSTTRGRPWPACWARRRARSSSPAAARRPTCWRSSARRARARGRGRHVVTSAIEHHAVLHAVDVLERDGWAVTRLPVDARGLVDPDAFAAALTAADHARQHHAGQQRDRRDPADRRARRASRASAACCSTPTRSRRRAGSPLDVGGARASTCSRSPATSSRGPRASACCTSGAGRRSSR